MQIGRIERGVVGGAIGSVVRWFVPFGGSFRLVVRSVRWWFGRFSS